MSSVRAEIKSKLPKVGTTIFTTMSRLAEDHKAINLAQGFPEFDCSPDLQKLVDKYTRLGKNQYAPMAGVLPLREAISEKVFNATATEYHPETEITITSGATEALYVAISTVVHPGDEVIVFEPAYDSYVPAIALNGGVPVFVTLDPQYDKIDWEIVASRISEKTRAIVINTPHNPTGKVWTLEDLQNLTALAAGHDLIVISDEVYEHIIFDGRVHVSASSLPALAERTFVCGSFGKTFHTTGWKVGYCLAPKDLTAEFRKIHQYLVFSVVTPFQFALAEYLNEPEHYLKLSAFYETKRNLFVDAIKDVGLVIKASEGSFFQNVFYGNLSNENDFTLAKRLTIEAGVASIPVSSFYDKVVDYNVLRFCFAKNDDTLLRGAELIHKIIW
ncbi:methionine aminotransferase [Dyadobacter psychrotolerans]|uniref:Aminotransferase class I/II-fold pyridoxal phosphate-dependent enzyme n=1 Tax=Dyadobacter psychrotolerans TaxID=2541721 RepID=A0A4R5DZE8_9BACT|nr:methionine aminotransferase [Dyadobacter psychrotolerans]TDE16613.1 aminotransferase class I/II-fold pyridoxal phosphate-dependent enzyme [Dyadobacter psychrotolerans]